MIKHLKIHNINEKRKADTDITGPAKLHKGDLDTPRNNTMDKFAKQIAQKLFKSMTERIQQRRHKKLISALLFLHSGKFPQNNQHLSYDSKLVIKKTVKDLSLRLFSDTAAHDVDTEEIVEDETDQDEMEKSIQALLAQSQSSSSVEKEIKLLEATGKRSDELEKLYKA